MPGGSGGRTKESGTRRMLSAWNTRGRSHPELSALDRKEYEFQRRLKADYGITLAELHRLYAQQDERCAICYKPVQLPVGTGTYQAQIDHDHSTGTQSKGKVRGLLCGLCNRHLSSVENADWLKSALQYLEYAGKAENCLV